MDTTKEQLLQAQLLKQLFSGAYELPGATTVDKSKATSIKAKRPSSAGFKISVLLPDVRIISPVISTARPSSAGFQSGYGKDFRPQSADGKKTFPRFNAKGYVAQKTKRAAAASKSRHKMFNEQLRGFCSPPRPATSVSVGKTLYNPEVYIHKKNELSLKKRRNKNLPVPFGRTAERSVVDPGLGCGPAAYGIPNNPNRPCVDSRSVGGIISKASAPSEVELLMKRAAKLPSPAEYDGCQLKVSGGIISKSSAPSEVEVIMSRAALMPSPGDYNVHAAD